MKYKKTRLKNGLRILTVPMKGTQTVTVVVLVGTGSRYESNKEAGISHFIEHMLFKGTKKRPATIDITGELDAIGGEYNAFTGRDMTGYHVKVDSKHLDTALDVVSDIYLNSKIDANEIEREKGTIIQELNTIEDIPMSDIGYIFEQLLYKKNPLGRHIVGTKNSISSFKRKNFIDYIKRFYVANDTVICIAGKFDEKKVLNQIKKYFLKMKKGEKPKFRRVIEKQERPEVKIKHKKTDQTHLVVGARAYDHNHQDRFALALLSIILGGNMSSRMFIEVRERRGLAYYIRTSTDDYHDCGHISTSAGVDHRNFELATKIIIGEYSKIVKNKVSEKELKKAKDYIEGRKVMGMESSDSVAMFFVDQELMKNKILSMEEIFKKINEVTVSDIQRVAKDIFRHNKLNLAVIGPHKDSKKLRKILSL